MKNALMIFAVFALMISLFAVGGPGQPENASQGAGTGTSQTENSPSQSAVNAENQTGQGSGQGEQIAQEQQTQNQGEGQQLAIQNQEQNQAGQGSGQGSQYQYQNQYTLENGNDVEISNGNGTRLRAQGVEAQSSLDITPVQEQNGTRLQTQLSNGRNSEIKIMPDTASETALMHLRIRNCNETNGCVIQLKEVGSGNEIRAAYQVQATKRAKLLGVFDVTMPVEAEVDAENGELIRTGKPWWAFLASEQDE